jgi:hypothetical protein
VSGTKVKLGRKPKNSDEGELEKITFRITKEAKAALERLIALEPSDVRGRRSIVLRRLILAADPEK